MVALCAEVLRQVLNTLVENLVVVRVERADLGLAEKAEMFERGRADLVVADVEFVEHLVALEPSENEQEHLVRESDLREAQKLEVRVALENAREGSRAAAVHAVPVEAVPAAGVERDQTLALLNLGEDRREPLRVNPVRGDVKVDEVRVAPDERGYGETALAPEVVLREVQPAEVRVVLEDAAEVPGSARAEHTLREVQAPVQARFPDLLDEADCLRLVVREGVVGALFAEQLEDLVHEEGVHDLAAGQNH